ncbi:MAG: transglycosylase SLT domain-containing protein [Chloroflexi bacterium]|nr:transglycosylase SLT domain-containing protein [Chloroflexota bacterium]
MAVKTNSKRRAGAAKAKTQGQSLPPVIARHLPAWLILAAVMLILLPNILTVTFGVAGQVVRGVPTLVSSVFAGIGSAFAGVGNLFSSGSGSIAPLFTDEVDHWAGNITRWAREYNLDPNLLATVMQIESCGHPTIGSSAGAQGLFQVMPFHFSSGEVQTDPETNAKRGATYLKWCVDYANGDTGLSLACYNGGPSVVKKPFANWSAETQRYYRWGTGIYADAKSNQSRSATLDQWLNAGGSVLCGMADQALGL